MLTTDLPTTDSRAQTAAILRAVAELIETQPGIDLPYARIHFVLLPGNTADVPGAVTNIVSALPGPAWRAKFSHREDSGDWLDLDFPAGKSEVTISAAASAVATADGTTTVTTTTRTVTAWQPHPAIAAALPGVTVDGAR